MDSFVITSKLTNREAIKMSTTEAVNDDMAELRA